MHTIHTTSGFIIDARPYGEADKMLSIFTRDFGLVTAVAKGIRLEASKLRYFAQEYSSGVFSLVRGKDLWRLTSAQMDGTSSGSNELIARIALLLRRLVHGEEPHPELFECIEELRAFLAGRTLDTESLKTLESLTVFRMMKALGYIGHDSELNGYFDSGEISKAILAQAATHRTAMNKHINKALKESHL